VKTWPGIKRTSKNLNALFEVSATFFKLPNKNSQQLSWFQADFIDSKTKLSQYCNNCLACNSYSFFKINVDDFITEKLLNYNEKI
jgi:hypothetical protein